jgi:predicted RNA-binding protein YlxR (DUF448 family)
MKKNYRRCVTCRQVKPRQCFFRVIRRYDTGEVCLDEGMGRSAYVCQQQSCIAGAQRKNRMSRALKAHIPEQVFSRLNKRVKLNSPSASITDREDLPN